VDKELQEKVEDVKDDLPLDDKQSDGPQYSEEETLAMTRGWKPKEEWEGSEDEWKPAKVFNEIGELKEKIVSSEKELKKTNKVIQLMKEHHLNVRQNAYKEAVEALKTERQHALKEQDFAKAEEIRDEIDSVKEKFASDNVLPRDIERKLKEEQNSDPDPEFYAFVNRNPWYKPNGGNEMSKKADALGWAYKQEDPNLQFADIIKKVEKDIRKLYSEKFDSPKNPVNEGGSRNSNEASSKKVKLSEQEMDVAKSFGMTPEEYVKELSTYKGR
jgi:hypothetical protein